MLAIVPGIASAFLIGLNVNGAASRPVLLGAGHTQIIADFVCEELFDHAVSGNSRELTVGRIFVNRMLCAFAQADTAVAFEMANQFRAVNFRPRTKSDVHE